MLRVIAILLLFSSTQGSAQSYINKSKKKALAMLSKYEAGNGFQTPEILQTDSTITFSVKDMADRKSIFTYSFDVNGKCQSEKIQASCDSCFEKYIGQVLANKKYDWKKINANQYISKYSSKLMLELPPEINDFSYMIIRTGWKKKSYRLLFE